MMRRDRVLLVAAGAAALLGAGPLAVPGAAGAAVVPAGAVRAAGLWGRAVGVPGQWALNTGGNADVNSVSCPSAGNCTAGGYYQHHGQQGFVVREKNGRWRTAFEVPGLRALNKGGGAQVYQVSCTSAGSCAAGGFYRDGSGHQHGFVVSEINGRWRPAIGVPGLGSLDKGGNADVNSISCASATSCAAVGSYTDGDGNQQGFVVSEINGRWRPAIEVPGLGTLNEGGNADVNSVSCGSVADCSAGGGYTANASHSTQAFVVNERNGSWGTAQEVAGNLNTGAFSDAGVLSVSCASAGSCSAGGYYSGGSVPNQGFVISEVNGTWAAAREVSGSLSSNGDASVTSVSCASAGNCSAGGDYDYDYFWGFVVSEKNGVWGQEVSVPGLGALADREAFLQSVSCGSPGNCAAGGDYEGEPGGFVVSQTNGVWRNAIAVPGLGVLGGNAEVFSVSCPPVGRCVAGGSYVNRRGLQQGFVTT
jgi:hypothetical protein